MTDRTPAAPVPDDVDFDTALMDPAAFYASPDDVLADGELSIAQKRRFLEEWAQDIEGRQTAADEGMGAPSTAISEAETERLQRIRAGLERLPPDSEERPIETMMARMWRRLTTIPNS